MVQVFLISFGQASSECGYDIISIMILLITSVIVSWRFSAVTYLLYEQHLTKNSMKFHSCWVFLVWINRLKHCRFYILSSRIDWWAQSAWKFCHTLWCLRWSWFLYETLEISIISEIMEIRQFSPIIFLIRIKKHIIKKKMQNIQQQLLKKKLDNLKWKESLKYSRKIVKMQRLYSSWKN